MIEGLIIAIGLVGFVLIGIVITLMHIDQRLDRIAKALESYRKDGAA